MLFRFIQNIICVLSSKTIFLLISMVGPLGYIKLLKKKQVAELYIRLGGSFKPSYSARKLKKLVRHIVVKENLTVGDVKAIINMSVRVKIKRIDVKVRRLEDSLLNRFGVSFKLFSAPTHTKKQRERKPKFEKRKSSNFPEKLESKCLIKPEDIQKEYIYYRTIPKTYKIDLYGNIMYFCSNIYCMNQGLLLCSNCSSEVYCNYICQRNHWKWEHKYECNIFQKIRNRRKQNLLQIKQEANTESDSDQTSDSAAPEEETSPDKLNKLFEKMRKKFLFEPKKKEPEY